jgi:predicted RNA-binding protein with TRAM domain
VGANGKATLPNVQMAYTPGAHSVGAQFTPTDQTLFQSSTATTANITVTKEDASIVYSADNTTAMKVTTSGGPLAVNGLTLQLGVKEAEPDAAGTGTTGIGSNIPDVAVSVSLLPVGPGSVYALTCTATGTTGSGYATTRNFTCNNPAALPVNVYVVQATLTSDYYQATQYDDVVTVYDPVAGFVTGGGTFRVNGDLVRFGINLKYKSNTKGNSTVTQGSVFAVRHHANGRKSRFESNSLNSAVAVGEDLTVPMGWAVVSGKSTYTTWDAATSSDVTLGGQAFTVYVEDRGEPGAGVDRVWMGGPGVLALPGTLSTAKTSAVTLTGGNVAVPHKSR